MEKLFVYGSLCPGQSNDYLLQQLGGSWERGYVLGQRYEEGWGALVGYPGVRLDGAGGKVEGYVFTSERLSAHWKILDDFEGEPYKRVKTRATLESGEKVEAFIYAIR